MAKIKVQTENGEIEVQQDALTLPENTVLADKNDPPKGLYNDKGVQSMVQDRLKNSKKNTRENLLNDEGFKKKVLAEYNIVLDDDNKPKGLKPTEDIDEVRQEVAEQVSSDYENKLEKVNQKLEKRNQSVIESAIMSAVSGNYEDYMTKSFDGETPLAVQKFKGMIGVDEEGKPFVKDENGNKKIKGNGPISVKDYLLDGEVFGEFLKDKTQGGSGFENGSNGHTKNYSEEDLNNMSDEEFEKNRDEIYASLNSN